MIFARFVCALLLFCAFPIRACVISLSKIEDCASISQVITKEFVVMGVTYYSDVPFLSSEFSYLVDINVGNRITVDELSNALVRLFQKNLFRTITLSIFDEGAGKRVHFELLGAYTFQTLTIEGIRLNREHYKHYYLIEPGDIFDIDKHSHSMLRLKEMCDAEGFCNARLKDSFIYDEKVKSVQVTITIERGERLRMESTLLKVHSEHMSSQELATIEKVLFRKFVNPMKGVKYSKGFINQQTSAMRQYLLNEGFFQNNIILSETKCAKDKCMRLAWHIDLGNKRTFVFFGNCFFSNKQLLDCLSKFSRSSCIVPSSILLEELKSVYQDKGFLDVEIDSRDEEGRSFFIIREGKKSFIDSVEINGAVSISQPILLKHCFPYIKGTMLFSHDVVNSIRSRLTDWYIGKGFLDAQVISHELVPLSEQHYKLVFTINEGECTSISDVIIPGYKELENQGPFGFLKRTGSLLHGNAAIKEQERWLIDYFRRRGYLFVSIRSEFEVHDGKTAIIWHVNPGSLVCFGKTIIQGGSGIPFSAVMRELRYKEGEPWDQEKIRLSFMGIRDLQSYDMVSFVPVVTKDLSVRPVILRLHKEEPFEVRTRAGIELQHIRQYATFAGLTYKLGGTFIAKSPFFCGDQFRFNVDVARSHNEIVAWYRYPWLFSLPMHGLFQIYKYAYEQPGFIGSDHHLYSVSRLGTFIRLRRTLSYIDVAGNLGFELAKTKLNDADSSLASQLAQVINFDVSLLGRSIPFIFVEPSLIVDLLDNKLNPTRGIFSVVSLKGMFPTQATFSKSYFIKLLFENSCFMPLGFSVLGLRIRCGHIFHSAFSDVIPTERFFIGGAHTVRSYGTDLTPPFGRFVNKLGKTVLVPQGGKTMLNLSAELRIPVLKNIGVVFFHDMGLLMGDYFSDIDSDHVAMGTGVGVRYLTPVGPLRFDIAWKWKKHSIDEHRYNWFLTFGQAF